MYWCTDETFELPRRKRHKTAAAAASPARNQQVPTDRQPSQQTSKLSKPKKRQKSQAPEQKPQNLSPSVSTLSVQLPRSQLLGCFGLPYSGEVHVLESGSALQTGFREEEMLRVDTKGDLDFTIAPGATDKEVQKGESI